MQETQSKILTETALVAELQRLGYTSVSVRTIQEWRRRELLPDFDQKGQGLGQGAGRRPSVWIDGRAVIERAAWVSDLIRVYGRMESAYLPLWMLGYLVPLKRVRKALRQPIVDLDQAMRREMKTKGDLDIEDVIDDALFEAERKILKDNSSASLDQLTAVYNLLFNPKYDPEKGVFDECAPRDEAREGQAHIPNQDQTWNLFQHASFIKEHLSFERIKETLRNCTVEDLKIIERDLGILREIVFHIGRMVKAMASAVPAEFTKGFTNEWHALFFVGRMCILADLSLRRSGHGDWVDKILQPGLDLIREMCNEEREAELRANSPQLFAAMQASMEELKRTLVPRGAEAPERRVP
jgi:hypothetical protein